MWIRLHSLILALDCPLVHQGCNKRTGGRGCSWILTYLASHRGLSGFQSGFPSTCYSCGMSQPWFRLQPGRELHLRGCPPFHLWRDPGVWASSAHASTCRLVVSTSIDSPGVYRLFHGYLQPRPPVLSLRPWCTRGQSSARMREWNLIHTTRFHCNPLIVQVPLR